LKRVETMAKLAGIELGGTSFVVAIGIPPEIHEQAEFPTKSPKETLEKVKEWLSMRKFEALGIASFGPVDIHKNSTKYGFITTTPKPNWGFTDVLGPFKEFGVPIAFETDVNAAAQGEYQHGNHGNIKSCCYVTVGTGIGIGAVLDGSPLHGLLHPEGGHIRQARMDGDTFEGTCPYHKDCVEGMASAGALAARANVTPKDLATLSDEHSVWDAASYYLGHLCATLTLILSPEVIVLSGGVLQRASLFPKIRKVCMTQLNGYIQMPKITEEQASKYIVPSNFGNTAGIIGALEIAQIALTSSKQ